MCDKLDILGFIQDTTYDCMTALHFVVCSYYMCCTTPIRGCNLFSGALSAWPHSTHPSRNSTSSGCGRASTAEHQMFQTVERSISEAHNAMMCENVIHFAGLADANGSPAHRICLMCTLASLLESLSTGAIWHTVNVQNNCNSIGIFSTLRVDVWNILESRV